MRHFGFWPGFLLPAFLAVAGALGYPHPASTHPGTIPVPVTPEAKDVRLLKVVQKAAVRSDAARLAGPYGRIAVRDARKNGLPPLLVAAVIHQENAGAVRNCAERVSPAGAIGPMQLMPVTAWSFLRVNPWNPLENISGGARYLAYLLRRFHSIRSALIAYNAGPGNLQSGNYTEASVYYARQILRNSGVTV